MTLTTGKVLKEARERLGVSQRELAELVFGEGRFQGMISRYEADVVEPTVDNLRKLSKALGLSMGDFEGIPIRNPLSVEVTS